MEATREDGGVRCTYAKGDLRRMLMVLGAIDDKGGATLVQIASATGLDKKTVQDLVAKASVQAGVKVCKTGTVYSVEDWGPVIRKSGAKLALRGNLGIAEERGGDRSSDQDDQNHG